MLILSLMFTGIITHLGTVTKNTANSLAVSAPVAFMKKIRICTSVSMDGICFTVTKRNASDFAVNYMPETWAKTTVRYLTRGDKVNLELPLQPTGFLSGHLVQGHVDGVGQVNRIVKNGNSYILTIAVPVKLSHFIVSKGSIAVSGISLTVISSRKGSFTVGIIPYTWTHTTLHKIKLGAYLNIETDIIARYAQKN